MGPCPLPLGFWQKRQPALLQRSMPLIQEPARAMEGSGSRWTKRLRVCRRCSVEGFMGVCFFLLPSFIYTYERQKAQQAGGTELITRELQKFLTKRLQDNHFTSETFENCKTLG